MRKFELKMDNEQFLMDLTKNVLVFYRPLRAKHFRLLSIPDELKSNAELVKSLNLYSIRNVNGIRFYMVKSMDDDLCMKLFNLDVPHFFAEPDIKPTGLN